MGILGFKIATPHNVVVSRSITMLVFGILMYTALIMLHKQ